MNQLSKKCQGLARAKQGLGRSIGIWGLYALSLAKNTASAASTSGSDDYLEEVASAEREFARNQTLRARRAAHAEAMHQTTTALEEPVCP